MRINLNTVMHISLTALGEAVAALDRISAMESGERARRASAVGLVLAALEAETSPDGAAAFLKRRAEMEVGRLSDPGERLRLARLLVECEAHAIAELLIDYAASLEELRALEEADAVLAVARALEPARPEVALRAARIARMLGDDSRALELYRNARDLDLSRGTLSRLADIGEALLAPEPWGALSRAIRTAVRERDSEAAAVGLEERARLRRTMGDRTGALRDLALSASRYSDSVDRGRAAFTMAEICAALGDSLAAREALFIALSVGDRSQKDFARARLYAISRDLGDRLGMRRWRSGAPPRMVSLSPRPASLIVETVAPTIARWRGRLEAGTASALRLA